MTTYDILLFLHILAAIAWIGGGVMLTLLVARARRRGGPRLRSVMEDAAFLGGRYFAPIGVVVLVLGILLVASSEAWSFGQFWIIFGLAGYAVSAIFGGAVIGPLARRAAEAVEAHGPDSNEARDAAGRFVTAARVDQLVLVAVVLDMVVKPGL